MSFREYLSRMKGGAKSPPAVGFNEALWAFIGAAISIGLCEYLSARYFEPRDLTLVIGSLGASAVFANGAIKSPMAQPRNIVGGHMISGVVGVACYQLFGGTVWLASALAVALAGAAMLVTKTMHPPGGATALIAVIGGPKIHALGFSYVLAPAGLGACILVIVALLLNNLSGRRRYPQYWL